MKSISLEAPAKVNLFLKVLKKRRDGYHELRTLFERIDLCDSITLTKIPSGIELVSGTFMTRDPRDNLMYKAALAVMKAGKVKGGVRISIKKRIPVAGGMGGGSSDAATVLIGVNKLYRAGLARKRLMRIGAGLGADVPFFVLETAYAYATGKGERLTPIPWKRKLWHVVVNPGFGVPTKGIFEAFDRSCPKCLTQPGSNVTIHRPFVTKVSFASFETMMCNDLEPVVAVKKRIIGGIIKRLAFATGCTSILSGSGPSVFCLCRSRKEAMRAKKRFLRSMPEAQAPGWQVMIAGTRFSCV